MSVENKIDALKEKILRISEELETQEEQSKKAKKSPKKKKTEIVESDLSEEEIIDNTNSK